MQNISAEEKKQLQVAKQQLPSICNSDLTHLETLYTPIKNKLITVSNFSVQNNRGNFRLANMILSNLSLQDIYLNQTQRQNLASVLERSLRIIKNIEEGKQCKDELAKHIEFTKILGSGSFGEVSVGNLQQHIISSPPPAYFKKFNFAVKMSHMPPNFPPYVELHIMKLLNNLVFNGIAQNLPVVIDSFKCNDCKFKAKSIGNKQKKCLFTIHEIASMDLVKWFETSPSIDELNSCLFQIMAGIHAYQHHYLILNTDIKAPNILVYDVRAGGYWKYTIYGREFYVPNYGKLFIVNDYGVASIYAPKYRVQWEEESVGDLGDRAFLINSNLNVEPIQNQFIPFQPTKKGQKSKKASFKVKINGQTINVMNIGLQKVKNNKKIDYPPMLTPVQKRLIGHEPNTLEFYNSPMVPSLSFMIDTQDAIKMFIGNNRKRMIQQGYHPSNDLNKQFLLAIRSYETANASYLVQQLSPPGIKVNDRELPKILAGFFILDYFTTVVDYTIPKATDLIISSIKTS